jgi:hypothetical protein
MGGRHVVRGGVVILMGVYGTGASTLVLRGLGGGEVGLVLHWNEKKEVYLLIYLFIIIIIFLHTYIILLPSYSRLYFVAMKQLLH